MEKEEYDKRIQELSERVLSKALSPDEENAYTESLFESIKHINEYGQEFWYARELQSALEYTEWRNFKKVIERAISACLNSENLVDDHFVEVNKMVDLGSGANRDIEDYELSRYACYLIVQNGDPRKKVIALGQSYFAVKTRQQELIENFDTLDEDRKRLAIRKEMKEHNKSLAEAANQDILDYMGSTELAANLFRATQTDEKIRNEHIVGKNAANQTHYEVGRKVRQTIKEIGGTMPEDLPTPQKGIKQIEREQRKLAEQNNNSSTTDI